MKKNKQFLQWIYSYLIILILSLSFPVIAYYHSIKAINNVSQFGHTASLNQLKLSMDALLNDVSDLVGNMSVFMETDSLAKSIYNFHDGEMLLKFRIQEMLHSMQMTKPEYEVFVFVNNQIITEGAIYSLEEYYKIKLDRANISLHEWKDLLTGNKNGKIVPMPISNRHGTYKNYISIFYNNPLIEPKWTGKSSIIVLLKEDVLLEKINQNNWMLMGRTYFVDEDGFNIFKTGGTPLKNDIFNKIKDREISDIDGEVYITKKSESKKWYYISSYPEELFKKQSIKVQIIAIFMSIIVFVLGVIAAYYFTQRNYKPLKKLVEFFDKNISEKGEKRPGEYVYIKNAVAKLISEKDSVEAKLTRQRISNNRSFLANVMKGRLVGSEEHLTNMLIKRDLILDWKNYYVLLFKIDKRDEKNSDLMDIAESDKLLDIIFEDTLKRSFNGQFLYTEVGDYPTVILSSDQTIFPYEDIVEELRLELNEKTSLIYTIGISSLNSKITDLIIARSEAMEALEYSLLLGLDRIIMFDDLQSRKKLKDYSLNLGTEMRFINSIRAGDYEQAGKVLNSAIDNLKNKNHVSMTTLQTRMFGMVSLMLDGFGEISFDISEEIVDDINPT